MYEITKSVELDAAHRVPFHESKCRFIHGHRYQITALLRSDTLISEREEDSEAGMVADFGRVKESLTRIHDVFDHRLMLWDQDPLLRQVKEMLEQHRGLISGLLTVPIIPTAENLAKYWGQMFWADFFGSSGIGVGGEGLRVHSFTVRETPTSFATYYF